MDDDDEEERQGSEDDAEAEDFNLQSIEAGRYAMILYDDACDGRDGRTHARTNAGQQEKVPERAGREGATQSSREGNGPAS